MDNALRYAPEGTVDIQATPVAGYRVALTVSDRGPGIADDEKDAVQQRFTRGRTGESQPGSGLGLAIVRSVAVAHGGSLWLQDRPGGGLSARVILPLARQRAGRAVAGWLGAAGAALLLLTAAPADVRAAGIPEIVTRYPAPQPSSRVLTIAGPTDTPVVAPLILGFQAQRPDVTVVYREMGSRELYEAAIEDRLKDVDVLMRLGLGPADPPGQRRLRPALHLAVCDQAAVLGGVAQRSLRLHLRAGRDRLQPQALHRGHRAALAPGPAAHPGARRRAAARPRRHLRYFAQQRGLSDGRAGRAGVVELLGPGQRLRPGRRAAVGDQRRTARRHRERRDGPGLQHPRLLRPVAPGGGQQDRRGVPAGLRAGAGALGADRAARANPDLGRALVDWLLSPAGQQVASSHAALGSIMEDTPGRWTSEAVLARSQGIVQPVVLSPALLVGTDQRRHSRFVQNWIRLVTDTPERP
ncbi:ATP-binding protein [Achromobacter insuavis]